MKTSPRLHHFLIAASSLLAASSALHAQTVNNLDLTTNNPGTITLASGDNTFSFTSFGIQYLIVAGGGGGGAPVNGNGSTAGGGGGAGGLLEGTSSITGLQNITVGAGGAGGTGTATTTSTNLNGKKGSDSTAFSLTAEGGGGGAKFDANGGNGGSGGGAGARNSGTNSGGIASGLGLGNNGGSRSITGTDDGAAGGGGAGGVGADLINSANGRAGGAGVSRNITGTNVTYAAGGGGGASSAGAGATGGASDTGGKGGNEQTSGSAATANTGGGGGGGGSGNVNARNGGAGGSGIVVVRYAGPQVLTGGTVTTVGGDTVHKFTSTGASNLDLHSATIDGNIGGSGNLNWNRTGQLTLGGSNTYTGATTITGGTLALSGTGSIANSSTITISSSTSLSVTGLTGNFTLGASQSLGGSGTLTATGKTVIASGTLTPGNSPGTLTQDGGTLQLGVGGDLNWQVYDANGPAGIGGFDTVSLINGATLDLSALSVGNTYNINLWSLSGIGPDANGNAINFNNSLNYAWTLFSTGTAINDFDTSKFTINTGAFNGTSGFSNTLNGSFQMALSGDSTDLVLTYTAVPEPGAALLGGLGLLVLLRRRRN